MAGTLDITPVSDTDALSLEALMEGCGLLVCLTRMDFNAAGELLALKGERVELLANQPVAEIVFPTFAIYYMQESSTLVIAIRGTTVGGQWLPHTTGVWAERWPEEPLPQSGYAHLGFVYGKKRIWPVIQSILASGLTPNRIVLVGHSYGAGVAGVLYSMLLRETSRSRLRVLTYGAPRVFTGPPDTGGLGAVYYRIQHGGDVVTSVPPPWANIRGQVASQLDKRVIAAAGGGPILGGISSFLAAQDLGVTGWKHWGIGADLQRDGSLVWSDPPEDSARKSTVATAETGVGIDHLLDSAYWPSLKVRARRLGRSSKPIEAIIGLVDNVRQEPTVVESDSGWDEAEEAWLAGTKATYLLPERVGIGDIRTAESVSLQVSAPRTSIGGSTTVSTMYRLKLYVNNTTFGKSVQIAHGNCSSPDVAWQKLLDWADYHSDLLGRVRGGLYSADTDPAEPVGLAGPVIEFGAVRDAADPRSGQVNVILGKIGNPSASPSDITVDNYSDPLWNALSITLYARYSGGGFNIRRRMAYTVVGFPDVALVQGKFVWASPMGGGGAADWGGRIKALLTFLTDANNGYGLILTDPAQTQVPIEGYALNTDGSVKITLTDHGYVDGEKVRVTRTKKRYLHREWAVHYDDANHFTLLQSQMTTAQLPAVNGKVQRVQDATGKRLVVFAPFEALPAFKLKEPYGSFNRQRRRARRFYPVSFSRSGKWVR